MFLFLFCGTGYDGILRAERVSERELYIERDTEREREREREREKERKEEREINI